MPKLRRAALVLVVASLTVVTSGCWNLLRPEGAAPLRYRDQIFTNVTVNSGITYGSATKQQGGTQTLLLDMYRPTGDTVTKRPAIVWVHGGNFRTGTRTSPELVDEANYFAKRGYVNVSIDYRLSTSGCLGAPPADCVQAMTNAQHDAQAAVRFLRRYATTYGIDPNRIAVGGSSAGAITAAHAAWRSDDPGASGNPGFASNVGAALSLSGCNIIGTANAGDAPVMMFHNNPDPVVPYSCAVNTQTKGEAADLVTILTTFEGSGHVAYAAHKQQILDESTNFLYHALDLSHAAR